MTTHAASHSAHSHYAGFAKFESYQYEDDESRVHFEMRTQYAHSAFRQLSNLWSSVLFAAVIGAILGIIATLIVFVEQRLVTARGDLIDLAFYGGDPCDASTDPSTLRARDSATSVGVAYATFVSYNTLLIFGAAMATYLVPTAASSGLPPLKAFLNGINVPNLLSLPTLIAKVVGVTLIVSTEPPIRIPAQFTNTSRPLQQLLKYFPNFEIFSHLKCATV